MRCRDRSHRSSLPRFGHRCCPIVRPQFSPFRSSIVDQSTVDGRHPLTADRMPMSYRVVLYYRLPLMRLSMTVHRAAYLPTHVVCDQFTQNTNQQRHNYTNTNTNNNTNNNASNTTPTVDVALLADHNRYATSLIDIQCYRLQLVLFHIYIHVSSCMYVYIC